MTIDDHTIVSHPFAPIALGTPAEILRRAGFPVEAYPVGWRTGERLLPALNISGGLRRLDFAMHEWIGLVAYRLTGRTDALFPAP